MGAGGRERKFASNEMELLEPRYPPPKEALDERGAVPRKMHAHVMSLSGIDSKDQRFEVELFVQARLRRRRFEGGCAGPNLRPFPAVARAEQRR